MESADGRGSGRPGTVGGAVAVKGAGPVLKIMSLAMRPNKVNIEVQYDCKVRHQAVILLYTEVLNIRKHSTNVSEVIHDRVPFSSNWKKRIDEDYKSRKDGRT